MRRTNAAAEVAGTASVMYQNTSHECEFLARIPWPIANRPHLALEIAQIEIDLNRKKMELVLCRQK
jgi:hypothetical protein